MTEKTYTVTVNYQNRSTATIATDAVECHLSADTNTYVIKAVTGKHFVKADSIETLHFVENTTNS